MDPSIQEQVIDAYNQGQSATAISSLLALPFQDVIGCLAAAGIDWVPPAPRRGRPRLKLLLGQRMYAEAAYRRGVTQAEISLAIRAALPRVRRHLIAQGLYNPSARSDPSTRPTRLFEAVRAYIEGEQVLTIQEHTKISPAELYKALRARGVALRTEEKADGADTNTTIPDGRVEDS